MVIEAAPASTRYCPQCKKQREVSPQIGADAWAYCGKCGAILLSAGMRRRYAGFWRRAGGYAIDTGAFVPVEIMFYVVDSGYAVGFLAFAVVLALGNQIAGNANGATLGKAVFGMRIEDAQGRPPGYKKSIGRYLMSIISGVLMIGYLAMIWDKQKQTWHDHAARTYVIVR